MIENTHIHYLNKNPPRNGKFVLYWMQQSQRAEYNQALQYAIEQANSFNIPLLVFFSLNEKFPEANRRHYYFMIQGLREVQLQLEKKGIKMVIELVPPVDGVIKYAADASIVVTDMGYLKIQKMWRQNVAEKIHCNMVQIESDVIVPVADASPKELYSAGSLRSKILQNLETYLVALKENSIRRDSLDFRFKSIDLSEPQKILSVMKIDSSVKEVHWLNGGTSEAKEHLRDFIENKLDHFAQFRNDPSKDFLSNLSPYLHFGQISPLYIALVVKNKGGEASRVFLEELIIRRELSMNFCWYNKNYDSFAALPSWAQNTLLEHKNDKRSFTYSLKELEAAQTYDPYWNAAQKEMVIRGKLHGYMRMYWGKKILEWMDSPEQAFKTALFLNNRYEIDGRDPNGFAGVAWCFGKHDRAWAERPVFGKVRYMSCLGLKRKFNMDEYIKKVNSYQDKAN
jgi:deoxyribodipyrimidine photo-lyase